MPPEPIAERIGRYVARPDRDSFDELAMAAFGELYEGDEAFRRLCDGVGASPRTVTDWRTVPLVEPSAPTAHRAAGTDPPPEAAAGVAFRHGCLAGLDSPPILQLAPGGEATALRERCGGPGSRAAATAERLEVGATRSWLAARQRDGRPAVIVATSGPLERLIGTLERQDLRFRLAYGSRLVVLTEQPDAQPAGLDAGALRRRSAERLALGPEGLCRELRWPGVPTSLYGRLAPDGGLEGASPAPWLRVRALDTRTLDELPEDEPGLLSVLDLTIRGRPFHLLTRLHGSVAAGAVRVFASPV